MQQKQVRNSIQYEKGGEIDTMFSFLMEEIQGSVGVRIDKPEILRLFMEEYMKNHKLQKRFEQYKKKGKRNVL